MASPQQNHVHSTTFQKLNHNNSITLTPWIYSSNLLHALRHNLPPPSKPIAASHVRATADRLLAATVKGRTRWSRAILASPIQFRRQHKKAKKSANGLKKKRKRTSGIWNKVPAAVKKARILGQLIPGCRKVSFQNLLEEAADYISALEMQIRAMAALTELFAGGALTPPPAPVGLS